MNYIYLLIVLILTLSSCESSDQPQPPHWESLYPNTSASFRGLSAVSNQVCWASGTNGTIIKTINGGQTWSVTTLQHYDSVDFRDIHAFDAKTALVLSAGWPAIILRTIDGGETWDKVYQGHDTRLFFDAIDFWDDKNGIAFSDALSDTLQIITTQDSGKSWQLLPDSTLPLVHKGQGGFAASGTCLKTFGEGNVIIGLGNKEATTLISNDYGKSWKNSSTPLDFGAPSKGNYSFDFISDKEGYCVGGDFYGDSVSTQSIAKTIDGGLTWSIVNDSTINGKYRSCIKYIDEKRLVASSRTGCNYSDNGGETWHNLEGQYYSLSVTKDGAVWASGSKGNLGKLSWNND